MNNAISPRNASRPGAPVPAGLLAGLLAMGSVQAGPVELSVQPAGSKFYSGQLFDIEIAIAGLDAADLGGFDVDLAFDPAVMQYQSYSLGVELADPVFGGFDLSDDSGAAAGLLRLSEAATLSVIDLASQPDAFVLATLSFVAQAPGISPLTLSRVDLSDALGDALAVDSVANGSLRVPLPGTLLLMPLGAGLLFFRRWRERR